MHNASSENTSFDLNLLRQHVERTQGREQANQLSPCLSSITKRQNYAKFHYRNALHSIEKIFAQGHSEDDLMLIMLDDEQPYSRDYVQHQFEAEAHILACIQSIHALSDILAHVIYFSLGLESKKDFKISLNRLYLKNLKTYLEQREDAAAIFLAIEELVNHEDFQYVDDVVNHSKHRNVITATLHLDLTGEKDHQLRFTSFTRHDDRASPRYWPSRNVKGILSREFHRQSRLVVKIASAINAWVSMQPPAEVPQEF